MASFDDHVRNMIVNFCLSTSLDIALRYLHPKADLQTAVMDDDYMERAFTEYWVDRAIQVTEKEAVHLEKITRDQGSNQRWHKEGKWRLTASRFGEVIKNVIHFYMARYVLDMIHSKQYTKRAMAQFEKCYKIKTKKAGFFVDKDILFLGATPNTIKD